MKINSTTNLGLVLLCSVIVGSQIYGESASERITEKDIQSKMPGIDRDEILNESEGAEIETLAQAQAPNRFSQPVPGTYPQPPRQGGVAPSQPMQTPQVRAASQPVQTSQVRAASVRPPAPIGSTNSPYAFKSYRLSYMQSDRALALLKALGFATVEYVLGRGESVNSSIFTALPTTQKYPLVIKLLDAAKTSLMQPALDGGRSVMGTDRLSGTYLHSSTTGAPEQRLLIIYEKQFPDQLNGLLNLLRLWKSILTRPKS